MLHRLLYVLVFAAVVMGTFAIVGIAMQIAEEMDKTEEKRIQALTGRYRR